MSSDNDSDYSPEMAVPISKPSIVPASDSESAPVVAPEPEPEPETETKTKTETETEIEIETDTISEPAIEESKPTTEATSELEPKPELKPEPESESETGYAPALASPKENTVQEENNNSDEFENQSDEIIIVDDNEPNIKQQSKYIPSLEKKILSAAELNQKVNVPLFTEVVTFFLQSQLPNDESFQLMSPHDKELVVLQAYNNAFGSNIGKDEINLNFAATTSYNKHNMRQKDEPQPIVPINPFCRRPDLDQRMSHSEYYDWKKYEEVEEQFSREFNCISLPAGSRLFVGNLAVNTLKTRDVWRVFHPYGKIVAVTLKQGFGFVQFTNANDCSEAIKGETHVPLHNKLMQLQISKTHETHTKMKAVGIDPEQESKLKNQSKFDHKDSTIVKPNVLILITPKPSESFNSLLVNTFQDAGIDCEVNHVETEADNVDQEIISRAAYGGKTGVVITREEELVDLLLFSKGDKDSTEGKESDEDESKAGAIRFDNYESISIESAVGWIQEHVKKQRVTEKPRERESRARTNRERPRDDRRRHQQGSRHDDRRYRDRDHHHHHHNNNNNNNNRDRVGRSSMESSRYNDRRNRDKYDHGRSDRYQQQHMPVQTTHYGQNFNQQPNQYNNYVNPGYQGYPPQQYPNQGYPLQGYPQQGYQMPYPAAAQQQQQPPLPPQQQYPPQGYQQNYQPAPFAQPPYGAQHPQQPGALPGMTTNPTAPIQDLSMGSLLSHLKSNAPTQPQPATKEDEKNAMLYETLARLKNNM